MYERYTDRARWVIFAANEEAATAESQYIEPAHLLLAIMRCCEPELNELLKLSSLEESLRADLPKASERAVYSENCPVPLSNQGKRVLAYAVEEAERLNSHPIRPGHLLLGVLREQESFACAFLSAHGIDLSTARGVVKSMPPAEGPANAKGLRSFSWLNTRRWRQWISAAVQFAVLAAAGLILAKLPISGKQLLLAGILWLAVVAGHGLVMRSRIWRVASFRGGRPVLARLVIYAIAWIYHLLLYGWVLALGIGIYRVATR